MVALLSPRHVISLLLMICMSLTPLNAVCGERTSNKIDDKFNVVCEPCPANCLVCYTGLHDINICTFCDEGYMLDENLVCKPCAENCSRCDGPELSQCHTLKTGYYLNEKTMKAEECDKSCARCYDKTKCMSCAEGYYSSDRNVNDNKVMEVTCTSCNIPNCNYCNKQADQVSNSEYLACNFCDTKNAVVSGHCESCPENCKYCKPESLECTFCETGFFLNKNTNLCEPLTIDNCYMMDGKGNCIMCEAHFHLDDGKCVPCAKKQEHCTYCTTKAENFMCLSCDSGFYKANDDTCKICPDKCVHCSEERCFSCENKHFYNADARECQLCEIGNCDSCQTSSICSQCKSGYFFNSETKQCEK